MLYRLSYFREIFSLENLAQVLASPSCECEHSLVSRKTSAKNLRVIVWVRMDSNHRSRKTADLQSAPFGHSGTHPRVHIPRTATQLRCIGKSLGCSALKITNLTFVQFLILVPYYHVNDLLPFRGARASSRTRTNDRWITNLVLYQLSYRGITQPFVCIVRTKKRAKVLLFFDIAKYF